MMLESATRATRRRPAVPPAPAPDGAGAGDGEHRSKSQPGHSDDVRTLAIPHTNIGLDLGPPGTDMLNRKCAAGSQLFALDLDKEE